MKIKCEECRKDVTKKIQALNKKLISRHTKQFLCIDCLARFLQTSVEELRDKIKQFEEEGCDLFL
ncbi:MAG: hypothetical protein NC182_02750 [Prevotella sp.]|nr:hypothetical protein [Staphylococcus sp.]MCM1350103.1 hypothetical protein [Prevotella sp.]